MATFKYRMLNHLYALDKTTGSVRIGHAVAVMRTDAPLNQKCTSNSAFIQMYDGKTGYGQFNKWKFDWTGTHENNVQNEWVNLLAIPNNGEGLDLDTVWYRSDTTLSSTSSQTVDVWFGFQSNSGMGNTKQLCKRTLFLPQLGSESNVSVGASSYDIGAKPAITITAVGDTEANRYIHTVKYKFGSLSGTIATNVKSGTINSWAIPTSFYAQIPNSTSGTMTITVETFCPYFYSEGTDADTSDIYKTLSLGTKSTTVTVNVPSSVKPTIGTVTLSDMDTNIRGSSTSVFIQDTAVTSNANGGFVYGKSALCATVQASGAQSSTIKSVTLSAEQANNKTLTGYSTVGSNNVFEVETYEFLCPKNLGANANTVTITATDSRGRTATKTVNYYAGTYMPASINQFDVYRCTSNGTAANDGTYLHIELDLNTGFGQQGVKLRNQSSSYFKISYKKTTASTYTQLVNSSTGASSFTIKNASGKTITAASLKGQTPLYANMISTSAIMDPLEAYEFKLETFSYESITTTARLGTTFVLMDFGANGKSIALGKISNDKGELEINMPMKVTTNPGLDTYVQPHYGECETAAGNDPKIVSIPGFKLIEGADVFVKFKYTNTVAVANLSMNVNGTGDKPIKRYGTTNMGAAGNLYAGMVCHFLYDGTNWLWVGHVDNNSNNYDRAVLNRAVKAKSAIQAGEIIVGTHEGYRPIAKGISFDITYPILWASADIAANATKTSTYLYYTSIDLTKNIGGWTGTAYSEVYLVLSSLVGTTAIVCNLSNVDFLTTTKPTSANELLYMPIGLMYDSTHCFFYPRNEIYAYTFGDFRKYPAVTDVTFSETLTSNSGVSPYSYYKNINIGDYIANYGAPLSATATDNSGVPVPCAFKADGNGDYLCVVAKTANVNVRLKFA